MVEMDSIASNSTSLSAKSCRVQVDLPSGGSEQARSVTCASIVPSIFGGAPLLGFSFIAESRPSWQYRFLIRFTLGTVVFKTSAISLLEYLSSAMSNILARARLLADAFSRLINWFRYSRSSSVKFTTNIVFLDIAIDHRDSLRI